MDSDLISVVNKLQETFSAIGGETVDLPQIVVVGSQSSGKSSVLENIVGRDFLPRGQGIVTRRPLVLQLVHVPSLDGSSEGAPASSRFGTPPAIGGPSEYGEFLHVDKRFYDFEEIRKEIESETMRVAGGNKGISRLPIHLKIYSTNVLNLTLVDLPGLTKIPVGDQPTDIERQIRALVLDYISKPNCVILAISPANVDLANSDALKIARTVDPQGRRTIGVLTKLDLMETGTNALDILTGRVYPLKLGFIGVVNRSQQDINGAKAMHEQVQAEADFFRGHPGYRNIAHRCGTRYLAKTLNQVLMSHIRDRLPDMKARLNTLMGQTQQELNAVGDAAYLSEGHRGTLVLRLMTQFVRDFVASIDGTSLEISTKELCGGARIYYIFQDVFGHALESINPTHNLTPVDIRTAIRNSTGPKPSLFVPELAFDLLVKPQIKLLEPPSLRCVEMVYEELMKICHNCTSTELQRYPRLHARLIECVSELLRERLGPTSEYVTSLISIQAAYINTNHPTFIEARAHAFSGGNSHNSNGGGQGASGRSKRAIEHVRPASDDGGIDMSESASDAGESEGTLSVVANGTARHQHKGSFGEKPRSASSPIHNRAASSTPNLAGAAGGSHGQGYQHQHHGGSAPMGYSGSDSHLAPPNGSAYGTSPGGSTKDSFLQYFFGANEVATGGSGGVRPPRNRSVLPSEMGGAGGKRGHASNVGAEHRADNPLTGRKGLEGTAAAFDMKSLDKHLDAGSGPVMSDAGINGDGMDVEVQLLQALISSYFAIVRQTIQDLVPKAIMHLLVNFSRESVQNRLVASLYKETLFEDLLYEDEGLVAERKRIKSLLQAYREAFQTLSEVL